MEISEERERRKGKRDGAVGFGEEVRQGGRREMVMMKRKGRGE